MIARKTLNLSPLPFDEAGAKRALSSNSTTPTTDQQRGKKLAGPWNLGLPRKKFRLHDVRSIFTTTRELEMPDEGALRIQ